MHRLRRADDGPAVDRGQRLVAEADPEQRRRAAASISSMLTPASSGAPGPGEITTASGRRRSSSAAVAGVVAHHLDLGARDLGQLLHQVVGEGVVVVDHQDHRRRYLFSRADRCGCSSTPRQGLTLQNLVLVFIAVCLLANVRICELSQE